MANPATKVPVYSVNDLKNTTDDALSPYLTSLPKPYRFTANNLNTDIRLLLGYSAVAIAGVTFYIDRKLGWVATDGWVMGAVIAYFILNTALTYWIWGVEAGQVFSGTRDGGEKLTISSSSKKYSPLYTLDIKYVNAQGKPIQEKKIETSFTRWFSADGIFHPEPLRQWLASEIEVLRLAAGETASKKVETIMEELEDVEDVSGESKRGAKSRKAKK
ncbi:hypothetical protein FQN54_003407 [Arachnomyces sp. PD_36]|nr:hypothetical protein FQN54_003407 [Arachnomyces sp. PD_36]